MDRIDFRSDTVTWPTPEMREAMAAARVGDDVYGEDPTVNELEAVVAARLGKEAGLFVASGTMGNLVAILTHAGRGDEAIVGEDAHTYLAEAGGMAVLGGIFPRAFPTDDRGRLDLRQVAGAIRGDDPHDPRTRLILVENTYGKKNGYPIEPDYFAAVFSLARQQELVTHMDGARLFNAAVALDVTPEAITRHVDSVSVCLSKGLCAPVGSVLCGSQDFIQRARHSRKVLGGGMRQAGVLAAAGLVALGRMTDRLREDHANARHLAEGLARIPGLCLNPAYVRTNIVYFELADEVPLDAPAIEARLRQEAGVWLDIVAPRRFRAVTHYWVGPVAVDCLLDGLAAILKSL